MTLHISSLALGDINVSLSAGRFLPLCSATINRLPLNFAQTLVVRINPQMALVTLIYPLFLNNYPRLKYLNSHWSVCI